MLRWKRILIGVTGSIAAYKAADLTSKLVKEGAEVRVALTGHAAEFVGPLTFQALSGNPVITDMFPPGTESGLDHIEVARRIDAMVLAPATANIIGKLAHGIADDWLSTAVLATRAPIIVCPAMNDQMFNNPIVVENLKRLADRDFIIAPTDYGDLACGETGPGRLIEPERIVELIHFVLADKNLKNLKILVTAGPTREHLDPVRYLSNPSTGKMGYACARVAARRGAEVTLVSGPSRLAEPVGVTRVQVTTAQEMVEACLARFDDCDVVIKAAGVSDYAPRESSQNKIKKSGKAMTLELNPTPDTLKTLSQKKAGQILVGFAAETENVVEHARAKMEAKNLDLIVANDVAQEGAGFGTDTNIVKILKRGGPVQELPLLTKEEVAEILLDQVRELVQDPSRR
ncbi:MAG: bifunctional phosphopantothenoylcysteine decarboxylase/phosphopantothenate--cysteine ligase CoaBC [Deltaproteobacteria bacterium]|nr:bifunctional phosphopantothenoylcysteine decarboxylase/phosphopantothenate--cysteine ligase CoaBC [Deltaproteobacteria bacterium]